MSEIIKGTIIQEWSGVIKGTVLRTERAISFLGDVDINTGVIMDKKSDIYQKKIGGTILVFRSSRGSTVGSNVLYGLAKNGVAPKLLIVQHPEPITISGSIFGEIPMIGKFTDHDFEKLESGIEIEAWCENNIGYIKILN